MGPASESHTAQVYQEFSLRKRKPVNYDNPWPVDILGRARPVPKRSEERRPVDILGGALPVPKRSEERRPVDILGEARPKTVPERSEERRPVDTLGGARPSDELSQQGQGGNTEKDNVSFSQSKVAKFYKTGVKAGPKHGEENTGISTGNQARKIGLTNRIEQNSATPHLSLKETGGGVDQGIPVLKTAKLGAAEPQMKRGGRIMTADAGNMCLFQCGACERTYSLEGYLRHAIAARIKGDTISGKTDKGRKAARCSLGLYRIVREVYHRCRLCGHVYLFSNQLASNHCRRHHHIKFKDYAQRYLKTKAVCFLQPVDEAGKVVASSDAIEPDHGQVVQIDSQQDHQGPDEPAACATTVRHGSGKEIEDDPPLESMPVDTGSSDGQFSQGESCAQAVQTTHEFVEKSGSTCCDKQAKLLHCDTRKDPDCAQTPHPPKVSPKSSLTSAPNFISTDRKSSSDRIGSDSVNAAATNNGDSSFCKQPATKVPGSSVSLSAKRVFSDHDNDIRESSKKNQAATGNLLDFTVSKSASNSLQDKNKTLCQTVSSTQKKVTGIASSKIIVSTSKSRHRHRPLPAHNKRETSLGKVQNLTLQPAPSNKIPASSCANLPRKWYEGTEFKCRQCSYSTHYTRRMEKHVRGLHAISAYSFPDSFTAGQIFMRCAVCGELVCHEKTALEFHLGSLHGLSLLQYEERFIPPS